MDFPALTFSNQLGYDVNLYDSFNPDNPIDAENNYLGHLTSLGSIKAKSSAVIKPMRSSSVFVFENASSGEPVGRAKRGPLSTATGYSIAQADEEAMTATIQFISFILFNPNHAMTKAFYAIWDDASTPLMPGIENFFAQYPDYKACTFQTYMMGIAYIAQHPDAVITPFPVHSLSGLVKSFGGTWPTGMPDITISHFSFSFKNNLLVLGIYIDLSTLPYETPEVANNVKTLGYKDTTVKVTLQTNFEISLGIFGTRLTVDFDDFKIPVGDSSNISITKPEAIIDINPAFKFVVFTLKGTIPFTANSTNLDANISMTIDNEEAHIGAVIAGDKCSFPAPPVMKGLFFDEAGIGMGLFFTPPAFTFGLETKFHIGTPKSGNIIALDDDTVTMVFKTEGEIPVPLFISFYIPRMDFNELIELFTNLNLNLDIPVTFSGLSFKWSENLMLPVVLPDGSLAASGYAFSAYVDILDAFQFYGNASLDLNNGLTADIEMSPINWKNIFKLTGDGKGTSIKVDANGDPIKNNFVPTTQQEKDAITNAREQVVTTPGGACLIINTLSLPILHLNAKASLFDLLEYDITADINKDGIRFDLDYGAILTEKMVCNLSDFHNLYAEFGYHIDISIPLPMIAGMNPGSIPLKADASLHLAINTSLTDVVISTGGEFDFESYHFSFGDFTADINISKISDFVAAIVQYIKDNAKTVFNQLLDTAEHWASAAAKGIVTGFDDAGKVMKNIYSKTEKDMAIILKAAGFAANDIANWLKNGYNATQKDIAIAMKEAAYTADEVVAGLRNAFNATSDSVADALKSAGYAVGDVATAIKNAWNCAQKDVAWAMMIVGFTETDVANGLRNAFNATTDSVADAMKQIGYKAEDVAKAIKNAWTCLQKDVAWAMMMVGFTGTDVANGLKNAFNATTDSVADAMKQIGYKAEDVANAIKNAWNCLQKDVAWAMMIVGFTGTDVANGLRNAFNATSDSVADAMKQIGYKAQDVAKAIKGAWNCEQGDVIWAMKQAGFAAGEVATAIKNCFDTDTEEILDNLEYFGYEATEAATAIKNLYGTAMNDMTSLMRVAGFAATDTANAIKNLYGTVLNDAAYVLKEVGYVAQETATALKTAYNATIDEVASVMKQVGYAATDVASALQSAFNTTVQGVETAMTAAGYVADDIANAFESLGGDFKSFADKAFDKVKHFFDSIF